MRTAEQRRRRWHGYRVVQGQSEPISVSPRPHTRLAPARPTERRSTTRTGAGPFLEEFDWDSLRRAWHEDDDEGAGGPGQVESKENRAERSLAKLNDTLRRRNLRRKLTPLVGALLVPAAAYLGFRSWRMGRA